MNKSKRIWIVFALLFVISGILVITSCVPVYTTAKEANIGTIRYKSKEASAPPPPAPVVKKVSEPVKISVEDIKAKERTAAMQSLIVAGGGIKTIDNYVAIFDFEVRTGDKDISSSLADSVIHEFSKSDKYEVIDRGNMNKILGEQKFQMSGCVAQECKVEAGQILGVGKIVNGSVGIVGKTYYLTLQLIDVKTGRVELSAEDKCKCEVDELLDSTKRLAEKLLGEKVEEPAATASKPAVAAKPAKPEPVKHFPAIVPPAVPARDGRFIPYDNMTVLDASTNLMWAAKDSDIHINWADAKSYCENYSGGGYTDWRMPTQDELAVLYDAGKSRPAACSIASSLIHVATELIDITCFWVWASETRGSDAAGFDFGSRQRHWGPQSGFNGRALPVRSVK